MSPIEDYLDGMSRDSLVNKVRNLERRLIALERRNVRFNNLEEVTNNLGLQLAGEFRSGNGVEPGNGFTGGRFGYPGFEYSGGKWFLAGVNNDALMVGLDQESGALLAANGALTIDQSGINLTGIRYALRHYAEDGDGNNPRYGRFEMIYPEGKTVPALAISFQDGISGTEKAGTNRGFEQGDFSQWVKNYELNGSWLLNTDRPAAGNYCAGFYITTSSYNHKGQLNSGRIAITGGKWYTLNFYERQLMTGKRTVRMQWYNATSGGYMLRVDQVETKTEISETWQLVSRTFQAPAGALGCEIWIEVLDESYGMEAGFMAEFDEFSVLERDLLRSITFEPDLSYQDDHSTRRIVACRRELPQPGTPSWLKLGISGNITPGTHQYKLTFVTASGETNGSSPTGIINISTPSDAQVALTFETGPQGTIARKIYRTAAGGSDFKLLATISNNTSTSYTDNLPDSALGSETVPLFNSTLEAPLLPVYAFVRWEIIESNLKSGGVWLSSGSTCGPFNLISYGANSIIGAKGDWFRFGVYLEPGKYTFRIHYRSGPGRGTISFYENEGSSPFATIDMYDSAANSVEGLVSGINMTGIGMHFIRGEITSKNISSSGYSSYISDVEFVRE